MATKLIINADDLGFSPGITDGILRSFREGILTSATLMTTMPDRDRALDLAGAAAGLGVGIHLCLTRGVPLTKCRRILSRDGEFVRSLPKFFLKLRSQEAREQAREEMSAQIDYARRRGLKPTHVDSHKHVAHLPALHDALIGACQACDIQWIRTAREIHLPGTPRMAPPYRVLASFARSLAKKATVAGLHTNDWFFGLATTGRTTVQVIETLARKAPEGLGELMVHPGYARGMTTKDTRLLAEREAEMAALCDPRARAAVGEAGIRLARFGESG